MTNTHHFTPTQRAALYLYTLHNGASAPRTVELDLAELVPPAIINIGLTAPIGSVAATPVHDRQCPRYDPGRWSIEQSALWHWYQRPQLLLGATHSVREQLAALMHLQQQALQAGNTTALRVRATLKQTATRDVLEHCPVWSKAFGQAHIVHDIQLASQAQDAIKAPEATPHVRPLPLATARLLERYLRLLDKGENHAGHHPVVFDFDADRFYPQAIYSPALASPVLALQGLSNGHRVVLFAEGHGWNHFAMWLSNDLTTPQLAGWTALARRRLNVNPVTDDFAGLTDHDLAYVPHAAREPFTGYHIGRLTQANRSWPSGH